MNGNIPLWIAEDVTWPVLWGLLTIGIFGFVWFMTRQFRYLAAAIGVAGLVVIVLIVETRIVTDKEYLVNVVLEMAENVSNNDAEGIVQFVREDNKAFASRIRRNMQRYDFHTCQLNGFAKVDVDPKGSSPRKANLAFSVWAAGSYADQIESFQSAIVAVQLEFLEIDGKWTVEAYGYRPSNVTTPFKMVRE